MTIKSKWAELDEQMESRILNIFRSLVKAEDLKPDIALSIVNLDYCPYQSTDPRYKKWQAIARKIRKSQKHIQIFNEVKERKVV